MLAISQQITIMTILIVRVLHMFILLMAKIMIQQIVVLPNMQELKMVLQISVGKS